MSKIHKLLIANNRHAVNTLNAGEFFCKPCMCNFGEDHDDFRSLSGQDTTIKNGTNDMLQVAKRKKWHFIPEELNRLEHWLQRGGEFENGKLQPVPFADEIIKLLEAQS